MRDSYRVDGMRHQPIVYSRTERNVPLDTYPSWTDERFSGGGMQTVFGRVRPGQEFIKGLRYDYDDRLREWDYAKHRAAWGQATALELPHRSAEFYEAYLSAYYGEPVNLRHVIAGVNFATGYPYVVFGYEKRSASASKPGAVDPVEATSGSDASPQADHARNDLPAVEKAERR